VFFLDYWGEDWPSGCRGYYRGVIVGEFAVDGEVKKPYQAPQLKEYGDLGSLTLGNVGTKMDNTGMGVFATKA
jgi:hypothetical protein